MKSQTVQCKIKGSTKGVDGRGWMDFLNHPKSTSIKQTIGDPPPKNEDYVATISFWAIANLKYNFQLTVGSIIGVLCVCLEIEAKSCDSKSVLLRQNPKAVLAQKVKAQFRLNLDHHMLCWDKQQIFMCDYRIVNI